MSKKRFTKTVTPSELNGISKYYDATTPHLTKDKSALTDGKQYVKLSGKQYAQSILTRKLNIKCKTKKQKDFLTLINDKEIVICKGPAGVGKSYLSIVQALQLLIDPDNQYEKIFIVTPIIESDGEKLGSLPGNINEKTYAYIYSTYYLIDKIIGKQNREKLVEAQVIDTLVLAYLRGVNIDNAILIGEECQNMSKRQMKTLLTRIGYNSKFILSGDMEQVDRFERREISGLYDAFDRFKDVPSIGMFEFNKEDVVRNSIIADILRKYDE